MTTRIPAAITTPDTVKTRLGTLKFFDGLPDEATVKKVYDHLDFLRGVDVFLNTMAAASTLANIEGLKSVGGNNQTVVLHENRVDAKTLLLTPNTQTATLWFTLDLTDGPMVMEVPPGVLGGTDGAGGKSAGDEVHQWFRSLFQHHSLDHLQVLRGGRQGHPGGTG
jgi:hypothetical protein